MEVIGLFVVVNAVENVKILGIVAVFVWNALVNLLHQLR